MENKKLTYGYDANGERVYKLIGTNTTSQLHSANPYAQAIFDDAILYPNPYMVVTQKGYTKHYYAGTERLATVIGGGGFGDMESPIDKLSSQHDWDIVKTFYSYYQNYDPFFYQKIVSQPEKTEDIFGQPSSDLDYQCKPTELVMVDILNPPDILLKSISSNEHINNDDKEKFFYHGDHLGSASWITDYQGYPVQYIHYAPYGEMIANQRPMNYDERYKFTGKERDWETGYDYFGARYLWSDAGIFISPDPHSDARPWLSSYAYCSWNPVNRLDPDGMDDEQREAAVNMANQYVKMNPGKSYKWGEKGGPGQKVDCSGLVSHCVVAGEEKDPNRGKDNGVRNIANNSQKMEDMNDVVAGNLVTFSGGTNEDYSHIGIVTDVMRDKEGNIVDFQFIHSGTSTGPVETFGSSSSSSKTHIPWLAKVTGFYKWDTRPDTYKGPTLPQITVLGNKPTIQTSMRALSVKPISANINLYMRR